MLIVFLCQKYLPTNIKAETC